MGEIKDKLVPLEGLQIFYNMFANAGLIPAFDEQNESMALAIINGAPQWTTLKASGGTDIGGGNSQNDTSLVASNISYNADAKIAWSGSWNSEKTLYVELTTNQHTTNLGNVLSFGSNIGSWSGSTTAPHVHIYYPINSNRSTIEVDALTASNTTTTNRVTISNSNELLRVACSKNGIYINGQQMTSTDITSFLNYYGNITTMQVGSQEGSNRYTGTYNEIRVFDKAYSETELQNITTNE